MLTSSDDTPALRKARGAFFTPHGVTRHLAEWAIQSPDDTVFEPAAGEAAFLIAAVARLRQLGTERPVVHGVELHEESVWAARQAVSEAGGSAVIHQGDFFLTEPRGQYSVAIGNPPYIRFQDFAGKARDRARFAAQAQGVALSGLSSAWAAFVVHAAAHLQPGGRLGMVLPAELLSTNYAAPVRSFLLEGFESVELVTFETQIFRDAEADTVLVKASGWGGRPAGVATLRQTRDAGTLAKLDVGNTWVPRNPAERWTPLRVQNATQEAISSTVDSGAFVPLVDFGETTLGMVTGNNKFFTLAPERLRSLGIPRRDLLHISPPGSAHLRGLALTRSGTARLGRDGRPTWLLHPSSRPAPATLAYIDEGLRAGVADAYKCRVRSPWWRVPVLPPADLLLTYMNSDTPRITTNAAGVHHLNSVHGVYLRNEVRDLARDVLPVASLNSLTLLGAELVGRSYGGGILKIEPREADRWWMPSEQALMTYRGELVALKPRVLRLLRTKKLLAAVALVDSVVLRHLDARHLEAVREDHRAFQSRRLVRGKNG